MQKKRVLHITHSFPPYNTPGALRNYNIIKYGAQYFDEYHLMLPKSDNRTDSDFPDIEHLNIHPVTALESLLKIRPDAIRSSAPAAKWVQQLMTELARYPAFRIFGHGSYLFRRNIKQRVENLIKERKITHLLTSGPPWPVLDIGKILKKKYPYLIWWQDIRDMPYDMVHGRAYLKRYFTRLLSEADVITTVSEGLARYFGNINPAIYVLRNGFTTIQPESPWINRKLNIVYTGKIYYPQWQDPESLFKALARLSVPTNFNYAGTHGEIFKEKAYSAGYKKFTDHGFVSREKALKLSSEADINILLTFYNSDYKGILTSKLYDYMSCQKPVLALSHGGVDPELEQIIQNSGIGTVVCSTPENILMGLQWILNNQDSLTFKIQPYFWEDQIRIIEKFLLHENEKAGITS